MATWVHGRPQPLPVSATPLGSVSSSTPPAELSYHGRGAWSWCLEKHCLPAPEMYTIAVLSSADTTLQKPAWAKTKSCRSPVSRARGKGIRPPSCLVGRGVDRERGVQCRVDEHQLVALAA